MIKNLRKYILILFLLASCKQNGIDNSIRDRALKLEIEIGDSMYRDSNNPYSFGLDSNEYNYKSLKAYYNNDTSFFKKLISDLEYQKPNISLFDTFQVNNIPNLRRLNIEEGYQFNYSETFCNLYYIITITKVDSQIKLNKIIYSPSQNKKDNSYVLKVVENTNKTLTYANWEKLINALEYADYWNLKPRDETTIALDPSHLTVLGIQKETYEAGASKASKIKYETKRTNRVARFAFKNSALYKAFSIAVKLADLKKLCKETL